MSSAFTEALHCRVRVSGVMFVFNRSVHALALVVVLALSLYRPLFLLLIPVVAWSLLRSRRAIRLRKANSIRRLQWTTGDEWLWQQMDGRELRGRLLDATVLGHYAVILRLRADNRRLGTTAVLLAADSLPPDTHRRLRACLTLWQPADRDVDFVDTFRDRLSSLGAAMRRR